MGELTRHIQDLLWCLLFVEDMVFIDETIEDQYKDMT